MEDESYLSKAINLRALLESNPELFDFKKLATYDCLQLLRNNPTKYLDHISPVITKANDKFYILVSIGKGPKFKKTRARFALSETDITNLDNGQYYSLLKSDFDQYIRKERFEEMPKSSQNEFFLAKPDYFFTKFGLLPKFTAGNLSSLCHSDIEFVDKHVTDYTSLTTYADFWEMMIKFNRKYEDIFLANTEGLMTKTDVRRVVKKFPRLVKKLDSSILAKSKLTVKEWVLLTNSVVSAKANKSLFAGWEFSNELKEVFREDLVAEVLMGKSKVTKRSQNAMDNMIKIEKVEDGPDQTSEEE